MKETLDQLMQSALAEIAGAASEDALQELRVRYLGKKGELTAVMKGLGSLSPEERPRMGQMVNTVKDRLETTLEETLQRVRAAAKKERLERERLDVTLPGRTSPLGTKHPISLVIEEISDIFAGLGFQVAEGPEVELDFYNFEALNFPKDHPARDMQDTFFVDDDILLRTHTSPVQVRTMLKHAPPVRIISPGTVYRCDSDATHSPMFHQIEGFMVDKGVTFGDLKGILTNFVNQFFGAGTGVRLRPSFFPFTEPSAEVDIACVMCKGQGCRVCKQSGWLEILGAGMIDPEVYRHVGYDPESISGFAFGMGIERVAMLKYGIGDLRLFFDNDVRFLQQFR
ncbi:phenylalanine--tRNA ligase subunit alpha [Geobacter sulfurreducens]|uniref:Phenylalanine--tRNA ligase alpha subunit n=1 Tax=Geobacter sulfurreducens (strain ATCC 51573 / DSM 12127 / PCA) TaxID=243231 RepID=SYFA_GEOSL|nr:phenylalanine--tRNA ligase subunit alpha [Geobacter sulfurreducens]Q74D00.1 RecName: Full=Phenylalanine--tRNA ligase alpha subunit; AltName: Full=Phenylalanyl-tRNA synthetase alpha subunit; Short=PheRS [Geobacter sulfurreducens PCA]AAR34893.1 phenylalanyl-tRNA synthetase, alpha subunit [Geobacter sulfurreducens PCA]ADI84355.2 phenylalanyl-tRNA synthetase, alpha subunit [Geobacter sulfurreducens KN400]AJY71596.1 phenylalanyl-tRNA synthetase subunit alpha [Geobacter sulfurreducens]QVW36690.1 